MKQLRILLITVALLVLSETNMLGFTIQNHCSRPVEIMKFHGRTNRMITIGPGESHVVILVPPGPQLAMSITTGLNVTGNRRIAFNIFFEGAIVNMASFVIPGFSAFNLSYTIGSGAPVHIAYDELGSIWLSIPGSSFDEFTLNIME